MKDLSPQRKRALDLLIEHCPELLRWLGGETLSPEELERQRRFWNFVDAIGSGTGYFWRELTKAVAKEHGIELTDAQAENAIWEYTGFPDSFTGSSRVAYFAEQLAAHFREVKGQ